VVVISGPGGVGKSTVVNRLVEKYPELWLSRSWTTREQRPGEDDDAYVFVSKEEFETHIKNDGFLEYTTFLDYYYGTPHPPLVNDNDIVLEIEVHGARQVISKNIDAVLIFLEAPSKEEQKKRLHVRGDSQQKIQDRLEKSAEEADAGRELGAHLLVNDDIEVTVEKIWEIIEDARSKSKNSKLNT